LDAKLAQAILVVQTGSDVPIRRYNNAYTYPEKHATTRDLAGSQQISCIAGSSGFSVAIPAAGARFRRV